MRHSIAALALVLAATAVWALGMAGPATAARQAPRIACPYTPADLVACCVLPPTLPDAAPTAAAPTAPTTAAPDGLPGAYLGRPDIQPICCQITPCCAGTPCCFPRATGVPTTTCCPTAGCCTPTPCAAGGLTIASSPNPSTAGRKVVIAGSMLGSSSAGAQVALWRELPGQSSFLQMATAATDSGGGYTFTMIGTVMTNQAWYVTSNGMRSATLQQTVHALVGLSSPAHSAIVGQPVLLHGRVTPSHAGEVVLIEQKRGGSWRVIARPRLARHSTYATSRRFAHTGTVELRTVLRGDARNLRSISRTVAVIVKP